MKTLDEHKKFSAYIKVMKVFFGIVTFLILVLFVAGQFIYPDERDLNYGECRVFESTWFRVMESGEKIPVEVPGKYDAEYGETVTLITHLPDSLENNMALCFRTIWQDVDIYINGELRQSYSTENTRPYGINSAFRYVFVDLNEEDAGGEMTYCFSSNSKYAGQMRVSYIGDRGSIWAFLVKQSGLRAVIAFLLLLLSLFCVLVCDILKIVYKKRLSLYYLAWAIFYCALWMLSEVEFRQILIKNVSVLTSFTYWSLMVIPFPMILYINDIQNGRYKKFFMVPLAYSAFILVAGTLLQVFDIVQFVQMLPIIHVGTALSIVGIIVTITIDAVKKRISDYFAVGLGVYGLLFAAVCEIILYYIGTGLSLGTVLVLGLLFLLIMAIIKTGQDLLRAEKKKQQAIMAREAQVKFLARMSHEIRTPINAVIGMNEMILRENENETIDEYAHNIQNASNMLLGLVNDILDFSKIESGQLELVEDTYQLASLIRDEVLLLNARVAGKQISTGIDIASDLPSEVWGDELRIKQILTNLLSNAVKYTRSGSVTLKAFSRGINPDTIELNFSVIDTGIGIKQEDLPKLFDRFKRLDENVNRYVEGAGLGLNIAKQLVELMNGQITVESEYGKGSIFTVSIPQKVMDKTPIGNLDVIFHDYKEKRKKVSAGTFTAPEASILIVDDNAMNLAVMKGLLKNTGIRLDLVTSGKACLEFTKKKTYNMILMDHMMPEMDGVETLHILRADYTNPNRNTVVIALTANAVAGSREMYLEYGFDEYFSKPIQVDKLEELLLNYLPEELIVSGGSRKEEIDLGLTDVDKELGMSYCLDSEEFYKEMLETFCIQVEEYLPQLEACFNSHDWEHYAIITHALKSNSLNIGAKGFSELSLSHEMAGKEKNIDYILAEYENYIRMLKIVVEKVRKMV